MHVATDGYLHWRSSTLSWNTSRELRTEIADILSHIESHLDDKCTKELLKTCPTTESKGTGDDCGIPKVFEDQLPDSKDDKPWDKVQKEAVNEVIKRVQFLHVPRAVADNPALIEKHNEVKEENALHLAALVATKHIKHNLTGTNWKALQEADPIISHVLKWKRLNDGKNCRKDKNHTDRRTLEEYLLTVVNTFNAKAYSACQKDLVLQNDLLYMNEMATNTTDDVLLFIVPACKRQAALDLCHCDAGHQGHDRTYSLLKEQFWWPKMRMQMMTNILNCDLAWSPEGSHQCRTNLAKEEAARHRRLYDRRAGVIELHPGDKVLVCLDLYRGASRKLVNRWSSTLHTVVGRIGDDVPAYVIKDDREKQQVLHWA